MRRIVPFICLLVLMSGCATTSMEMSASDVSQRQSDEGVVFGSILLKHAPVEGEEAAASGRKSGKTWKVSVAPFEKGESFSIKAQEEVEKPFVTKLAGGKYRFISATANINLYTATMTLPLLVTFHAEPGKVLYIGQLVVEMTDKKTLGLVSSTDYHIKVNDTLEATTESLESEYGQALEGAEKELMGFHQ